MENASKALIISGGVLLAVIIMSLISYFFAGISEWPQQQDDTDYKEQLAKFNQEYEVYAKSAMYGTDVISCLNKVVNFDEKYVEEDEEIRNEETGELIEYKGGWLSGTKYGGKDEFLIDVSVKFNKELEESLEVYHFKNEDDDTTQINLNANKEQLKTKTDNENEKYKATLSEAFEKVSQIYDKIKGGRNSFYSKLLSNKPPENDYGLYTRATPVDEDNITNGGEPISLLDKEKKQINKSGSLYKLANLSNLDLKVTIKNKDTDSKSLRKWSTVIWKTALYDLKTRRFRCDGIEYNTQTGRVSKISFSEI